MLVLSPLSPFCSAWGPKLWNGLLGDSRSYSQDNEYGPPPLRRVPWSGHVGMNIYVSSSSTLGYVFGFSKYPYSHILLHKPNNTAAKGPRYFGTHLFFLHFVDV